MPAGDQMGSERQTKPGARPGPGQNPWPAPDPRLESDPPAQVEMFTTSAQIGAELTRLREQANLTVREVGRACGLAAATVGGYFTGTHLPTPKLIDAEFTVLLKALGVQDEVRLRAWRDAVRRARRAVRRRGTGHDAPYRGLARFEPQDAPWFFGREELTRLLAKQASQWRTTGWPLAVIGASGSGKSSLLRAGLFPLLGEPDSVALLTPGHDPSGALARATALPEPPQWVVVDQFEELFTHGIPLNRQAEFIQSLSDLAGAGTGVVLGMRADFYASALAHPELARILRKGQVLVGPMSREELRDAIAGPARRAGAQIEDGLVELLIEQCAEFGRDHAGTLPLLSHALLTTWHQCRSGALTTADYLATGGIAHSIAQSAEEAYHELSAAQQLLTRQVFIHLVHVADGTADTARRVPPGELPGAGDGNGTGTSDGDDLSDTLGVFIDRRLLTAGADAVRITHEALLGSWPRLRSWLDEDRAALLAQRRVGSAAEAWREAGRDPATLLRGAPLAAAQARVREPGERWRPTPLEREFLDASSTQRGIEERARLRAARRLRVLAGALAALLMVAAATATYAFVQRGNAQASTRLADSRAVAEAADGLRGLDPATATQLSLAAYRIAPTTQARSALYESTDTPQVARAVDGGNLVQALAVTPDGRTLAAADADGTLRLWNIAAPEYPVPLGQALLDLPHYQQFAVAISPDGRLLAVSGGQKTISLWNITDPQDPKALPALTGPADTVFSLSFSSRGSLLAAASADGNVYLYNAAADAANTAGATSPSTILAAGPSPNEGAQSVAFSPDGAILAAGTTGGALRLWSIAAGHEPAPVPSPPTLGASVLSLAFSPNGRTLASGTQDMRLQFWTVSAAEPGSGANARANASASGSAAITADGPALTAGNSWVNALAFSPDGTELAVGTSAKSVQLWNTATHTLVGALPHPEPVASVAWSGTHTLISGCADGLLRLWSLPSPQLAAGGIVNSIAFSPSGNLLAVAGGTLRLWDPLSRQPVTGPFGPAGLSAEAVAFSPRASLLAEGLSNGTIQLWNVSDPAHPAAVGAPWRASATGNVEAVAFSPDGRTLASGGDDGTARLWNVTDPAHPAPGAPNPVLARFGGGVYSVAFSADGAMFAAGSVDRSFRLWRVTGPGAALPEGTPITYRPNYVYSVVFSPDAPVLAVGIANGTVELWNITDPAHPALYGPPLIGPSGYMYALAFSPDGTTLAGAATDDNLWLWNVADPRAPAVLATLTNATDSLFVVAFSPDGNLLAAGGADGYVYLWQPVPQRAQQLLCTDLGQPLTAGDWARYAPGLPMSAACP
jgi:WD40 repeat protein/transcriptional regulator with XRE-family HTH domain